MFGQRLIFVVLMIVLATILMGCERPSQRELTAARAALDAAKDAQAETYASVKLGKAIKAFEVAEKEFQAQSEKGLLVRRFDRARRLFSRAQHAAESAFYAAEAGRKNSKRKAGATIQTITDTLSQADAITSELESCTRNLASFRDEAEMFRDALDTQVNGAAMVEEAIASGDFAAALRLAGPVLEESSLLLKKLQKAKVRSRC